MTDAALADTSPMSELPAIPVSRARHALLKRLADVCCLPGSRVNTFERAMTADLLVEMLREATTEHRRLIAARRNIGELLCEALIELEEPTVIEALLRNTTASLSQPGIEAIVGASRLHDRYVPWLLRRPELRPSHAYVLFWWTDSDCRRAILQRFAVSREVLQEAAGDVFPMMAEEKWQDPLARKALQFIERRQRNRAAIEKSPYDSLDDAIEAGRPGLTREGVEEISHLAGLKPATGAKIFTDVGGEPLAVLCKATGLPKSALRSLWVGLRRPEYDEDGEPSAPLERVLITYDMIAVDRAQTVLRYWNWALSSALTPSLMKAIRDQDADGIDEHSAPQKAAMLVFAAELAR